MAELDSVGYGPEALREDLAGYIKKIEADIKEIELDLLHIAGSEIPKSVESLNQYETLVSLVKDLSDELSVDNFTNVYNHIYDTGKPDYMVDFWGSSGLSQEIYDEFTDIIEDTPRDFITSIAIANFKYKLTGNPAALRELRGSIEAGLDSDKPKPSPQEHGTPPKGRTPKPAASQRQPSEEGQSQQP